MQQKIIVGQVAEVVLPELAAHPIQARVDTGAKTSAIWASRIIESPRGLAVVFFDKGFPLYTGQPIYFADYAQTIVVSSNGVSETRYKVQLLCQFAGRNIRTWFTLANRSTQVYPLLLGRNTLRGKFLVDVSTKTRLQVKSQQQAVRIREPRKEA